jgi:hypothetical protein
MDRQPRTGLVAYPIGVVAVPRLQGVEGVRLGLSVEPSPLSGRALVRYVLPKAEEVTIRVYDVAGRRVATLVDHSLQPAGAHALALDGNELPLGILLCRIEAGARSVSTKLVHTR